MEEKNLQVFDGADADLVVVVEELLHEAVVGLVVVVFVADVEGGLYRAPVWIAVDRVKDALQVGRVLLAHHAVERQHYHHGHFV